MKKKILREFSKTKGTEKWEEMAIFSAKIVEEQNNNRFQLFYSRLDTRWTAKVRGKKAGLLVDDGNGVTIALGDQKIRLDYCQVSRLKMLLTLNEERNWYDEKVEITEMVKKKKKCKCGEKK
jgi:hypothetical protein